MDFDFRAVEEKWRRQWNELGIYKVTEDPAKPKFYVLDMFPYPSGAGLHVGHPLGYVASDIFARYKRLKGFNVLHPMGYDAFGLPAEQYAIETGTPPEVTTENAIKTYRSQLDKIGFSYDWSRQVKTCDPKYYKWTQWIFLQLYDSWYNRVSDKAEPIGTLVSLFREQGCQNLPPFDPASHETFGPAQWDTFSAEKQQLILMNYRLAYQSFSEVNWCEALGTVLANDEVKDGKSERGGHPVERRKMRQWFLRITKYAERLLAGLEGLDWSEAMKEMQRNWIGKSEGASVRFAIENAPLSIEIFTTRPDTIFGATFMVIAPEHELVAKLCSPEQQTEVETYIAYVKSRTDVERQQEKRVTGVFTGSYALNPFSGEAMPVWIAEYVLSGYGTGAVMAVPANDERDRKFAEKFGLPVKKVIDQSMHPDAGIEDKSGRMIHSGLLDGLEVKEALKVIIDEIELRQLGKRRVNFRLRDAGFSRQRYWGEPFPIVYKEEIPYPLPESELPLELPEVKSYKPGGDGRSPLANSKDWLNLPDGGVRETDTMPGYAGSSWYFLRYMDPHNELQFAGKDKMDYWCDVDLYLGGSEHAVGHLLYARLWHKFLFDRGYVPTDEPFKKLVNQGMILGVSAFLYRLIPVEGKPIFISYSYLKRMNLPPLGVGLLDNDSVNSLLPILKTKLNDGEYLKCLSGIWMDKIHVDTSLVKNEELDINRFKTWRQEFQDATIIDDASKFTCEPVVEKMSKSKYNVINPDIVIEQYGADCFRMFEMFLGPLDQSKPWDDKGIDGVAKFIRRFWRLFYDEQGRWNIIEQEPLAAEYKTLHKTIKKIAEDIERLSFNTCISQFMICLNELSELKCHKRAILEPLLVAMAPFAPFLSEELWQALGNSGSIHQAYYPIFDEKYLVESTFTYPVSVNGKVRAEITLALDLAENVVRAEVLAHETIRKWTSGSEPKKFVYVKGRIINVVV